MMKKEVILLSLVFLIFLSSCAPRLSEVEEIPKVIEEPVREITIHTPLISMGSLCSGEEECKSFCLNNLAQCEDYCREDLHNKLCNIIIGYSNLLQEVNTNVTTTPEEDCSDFYFSHYLVDPNLLKSITPIGGVGAGNTEIVGRSYIFVKDKVSDKVPLYAPTDMVLISGSYYQDPAYGSNLPEGHLYDYALNFNAGCDYFIDLSHVKEVIPAIKERLPPLSTSSARQQVQPLNLKAGNLIGYYIKGPGSVAFDFIVDDLSVTNTFANQKRYEAKHGSNILHSTCPYDYYRGEMREAYYKLLGGSGGTVISETDCGTVSRDVTGTISSQWFLNPDPATGRGTLILGRDAAYGNPLPIAKGPDRITIGNIGASNVVWIYPNNPTYKDPSEVRDEHCYQSTPSLGASPGYVYFKLVDDMTLDVYYSETGTCPSGFPSGAKRYYR